MILPIEKQVCSLELAKRLKELGVPKESYFKWHSVKGDREKDCYVTHDDAGYGYELCAAFTVAELGEMLPFAVEVKGHTLVIRWVPPMKEWGQQHQISYVGGAGFEGSIYSHSETEKTEADARAKLLIWLIENNLVSPAPAAGGRRV